jgi:hypothetical protein
MTSGSDWRHLNKPQTEEARRSIRPAYHGLPAKLQHFPWCGPTGEREVRCLAQPILGTGALDVKTFEQEDVSGHQKADRNGRKPAGVHRRTISQDIALMLNSRLTFKEAIELPDQSLMSRHRLKVAQRELRSRLESLGV